MNTDREQEARLASGEGSPARVLIIGAGPAGLATAAALRARGIAYDHVEQHSGVGGLWDIDNPFTPMYESAHFISSKAYSNLPGVPFGDEVADYPSRRDIVAYLRGYAEQHGVAEGIRFGCAVERVECAGSGGGGGRFVVHFRELEGVGEGKEAGAASARYEHVVCATGTLATPIMPEWPGMEEFEGEVRHSATYRGIDELRGRRVLVIGGGNSGCDIACDAAAAAERAEISMRRGYWFIPKHIFGRPADSWTAAAGRIPVRLQQWGAQAVLRVLVGDLRALGLPKPDHRIFETHPLVGDQILHYLRHGDLRVRADVAGFGPGREVQFRDGSRGEYDLVLCATGYRHAVPVAAELFGPEPMAEVYLGCAHRELPGLWTPGLIELNSGGFGVIGKQAELIGSVVADGALAREFAARAAVRQPDLSGGLRMDRSHRHIGYSDSHALHAALDEELAWCHTGR